MKSKIIFLVLLNYFSSYGQDNAILKLDELIDEALKQNLSLKISSQEIKIAETKVEQTSLFGTPEITFRLMEMPGIKPSDAMFANFELMQEIIFPKKINNQRKILNLEQNIQNQKYLQQAVEITMQVKTVYFELWMVQQSIEINKFKDEILNQVIDNIRTKLRVGLSNQQDLINAEIEQRKNQIEKLQLKENEEASFAMLAYLLNRDVKKFNGVTNLTDSINFNINFEQILSYALKFCSKLRSDSLQLEKSKLLYESSKLEYYPNFKIGVEYVTSPLTGFKGWSLTTGITLPFAFWKFKQASSFVEENEIGIKKSQTEYYNERNMLLVKMREYYSKLISLKQQNDLYRSEILPLVEQSLNLSLIDYQMNKIDFLNFLISFNTYFDRKMEAISLRAKFEKTLAELEKEIGCRDIEEILSY